METLGQFAAVGKLYSKMALYGGGTGVVGSLLGGKCKWAKCDMAKRHPATYAPSSGGIGKHKPTGSATLLILLLLTILSGLGMEVYLKANAENRMVRRVVQSQQAVYVAEGGIEWAKAHLLFNPELRQGSVSLATGHADIVIELNGGEYIVTSEGRSGLAVRKIEQIIQLENGKWVIKSYQELHQ